LPGSEAALLAEQEDLLARNERGCPGPSFNAGSAKACNPPLQGGLPNGEAKPRALSKQTFPATRSYWNLAAMNAVRPKPRLPKAHFEKPRLGLGRGYQNRASGFWRHDQPLNASSFDLPVFAGSRQDPKISAEARAFGGAGSRGARIGCVSSGRMLVKADLPSSNVWNGPLGS